MLKATAKAKNMVNNINLTVTSIYFYICTFIDDFTVTIVKLLLPGTLILDTIHYVY